ncbi:MAG: beta-galactosidase, partial [Kiritimatiellae bacterium]|nr:beta-galactosidase [Kiritimatiellia bacterium]
MKLTPVFALLSIAAAASADFPRMEVGICAHIAGDEFRYLETALDRVAEAGLSRVRADFTWAKIEPSPGAWRFEVTDRVMDEAAKRGIRILPILCYDNPKAYPGYAWQNPEAWRRFVQTVVDRYRGALDAVEIWNEENIPFWKPKRDPAQYTGFLRLSYSRLAVTHGWSRSI